jgi:hypothetical protein
MTGTGVVFAVVARLSVARLKSVLALQCLSNGDEVDEEQEEYLMTTASGPAVVNATRTHCDEPLTESAGSVAGRTDTS